MKKTRPKLSLLIAASLAAIAILAAAPGVPASAATLSICGNSGTGYCLNDWSNGNSIKMYYGNSSNENFFLLPLYFMCNSGRATSTCPINVSGVNLTGDAIVEAVYNGSNSNDGCVATTGSALAFLGSCPDLYGNGGTDGTIMVVDTNGGTVDPYLVDRYWTNRDKEIVSLTSGGNPGLQAYFGIGLTTLWGGSGVTAFL